MPKGQGRSENQKLKMLYLKKFFEEKTDEEHSATMQNIIDYLKENGIKEVRRDDYGKSYQLIDREFELAEIKLITDSIASSKFLSESKSDALIKKLGTLISENQRKELRRQVRVMGRAKSMNNSVLINTDIIHRAITEDTTITFKYFHYNTKLEREYVRKGEVYEVSPWALLYDNDNYYLYCSFNAGKFYTFRVDRMANMEQGKNKRQGIEEFEKADMSEFSKSTFGMYSGKQEKVSMVFNNKMIDTVIDKFGKNVWITKEDNEHVKVIANVSVSPQFFAWIFGLGNSVTVTGPDSVVKQMKDMLKEISNRYE